MLPNPNRTGRNSRLKCRGPKVIISLEFTGKRFLNHPLVCRTFVVELVFFPRQKNNKAKVMEVLKEPRQDKINFYKLMNMILIFLLQCTLILSRHF